MTGLLDFLNIDSDATGGGLLGGFVPAADEFSAARRFPLMAPQLAAASFPPRPDQPQDDGAPGGLGGNLAASPAPKAALGAISVPGSATIPIC
jgi:hypothetical protein